MNIILFSLLQNLFKNELKLFSKILDKINTKSLKDSNNELIKKINPLNLEFYLETEKFLSNKYHSINCKLPCS